MVGDLKNGRTVHSLVRLLSLYSVTLNFVAPPGLAMPESVKLEAEKAGIQVFETPSLASVIAKTDVLYVTRVQQERFTDAAEYERVKNAYVVNNELLAGAKEHCIVMHPLPRNAELDPGVDVSRDSSFTVDLGELSSFESEADTLFLFSFPLFFLLTVRPTSRRIFPSKYTSVSL